MRHGEETPKRRHFKRHSVKGRPGGDSLTQKRYDTSKETAATAAAATAAAAKEDRHRSLHSLNTRNIKTSN